MLGTPAALGPDMRKHISLALAALLSIAAFGGLAIASNGFRTDLPTVKAQENVKRAPASASDPAVAQTLLPSNRG